MRILTMKSASRILLAGSIAVVLAGPVILSAQQRQAMGADSYAQAA